MDGIIFLFILLLGILIWHMLGSFSIVLRWRGLFSFSVVYSANSFISIYLPTFSIIADMRDKRYSFFTDGAADGQRLRGIQG